MHVQSCCAALSARRLGWKAQNLRHDVARRFNFETTGVVAVFSPTLRVSLGLSAVWRIGLGRMESLESSVAFEVLVSSCPDCLLRLTCDGTCRPSHLNGTAEHIQLLLHLHLHPLPSPCTCPLHMLVSSSKAAARGTQASGKQATEAAQKRVHTPLIV